MADNKILENEKLDMEELDNVAGGTLDEFNEDVKRFKELNVPLHGLDEEGGPRVAPDLLTGSLIKAFKKHGVTYIRSFDNPNQYLINGKQVSQAEAWKHVYSQHKK